jgi:hypothetical protein
MKSIKLWEGPSEIDGSPIMVIATGLKKSKNSKTGAMIQTWILRSDITPVAAVHSGADSSVCGHCPHRGQLIHNISGEIKNTKRSCYVLEFNAPQSIYASVKRGNIPSAQDIARDLGLPVSEVIADIGSGELVRMGAYGDPAAVPAHVWRALLSQSLGFTGYTHQWRELETTRGPSAASFFRAHLMASADSAKAAQAAHALGWRTFRVKTRDDLKLKNEASCPASAESGHKLTCSTCLACGGGRKRGSIVINAHGSTSRARYAAENVAA